MNWQLIASLVKDVAVPEILRLITAHHAATGELPTEDELRAQLVLDVDTVQAAGQAFLDATRG